MPSATSLLALVLAVAALAVAALRPIPEPTGVASRVQGDGVTIGTTPERGLVPGSGSVEVRSPARDPKEQRSARLTMYEYGSTIQTTGKGAGLMELFLGDQKAQQPELSVKANGRGWGARIQARDSRDTFGVGFDLKLRAKPYIGIIDHEGVVPGATLTLGNPEPDAQIEIATGPKLTPRLRISADGTIDLLSDRVRLHGSERSGRAPADPGAVGAGASPAEVAEAVAVMRRALLEHGLLADRP